VKLGDRGVAVHGIEGRLLRLDIHERLYQRLFAGEEIVEKRILPAFAVGAQSFNAAGHPRAMIGLPAAQLGEYLVEGPVYHMAECLPARQGGFRVLTAQQLIPA